MKSEIEMVSFLFHFSDGKKFLTYSNIRTLSLPIKFYCKTIFYIADIFLFLQYCLSLAKNYFMKFKIILLASFFAGTGYTSYSQTPASYSETSDAETDAIINLLGVQKKEAVSKLVSVSAKDSVAFWKIYDEYQAENKKTAKDRLQLYERTAHAYSNLTPAIADSLASQYFTNRVGQEKTLQ